MANLSSRNCDVQTYPLHKAYLYSKKIGISKLYAQFAAGVFAGAAESGQKYKVICTNNLSFISKNCINLIVVYSIQNFHIPYST